jgi:hypothetical protein
MKPWGGPKAALERRRLLARAALLWEAVWPRLWPALGLLGVFLVLALLGLPALLPGGWHMLLLAAAAGGLGFLLWRGFRDFRRPATPRPSGDWSANPACATGRSRRWRTARPATTRRPWPSGRRTRRAPPRRWRSSGSARRAPACRRATRWRCAPRWPSRWWPPSPWPAARRRNGCAAPSCPNSAGRRRRPRNASKPG